VGLGVANVKIDFQLRSMKTVFAVAGVLVVLAAVFPMTNSLGQGVDEQSVTDWRGVLDPVNHIYRLRMDYSDGTYSDVPMNALPANAFLTHSSAVLWFTEVNDVTALASAYQADPQQLERVLGTHRNVSAFFHLFASAPVAYTPTFLKWWTAHHMNPSAYGGPNIPPGSVPYDRLPGGVLQIDTAADANTLVQCQPGEMPLVLKSLTSKS